MFLSLQPRLSCSCEKIFIEYSFTENLKIAQDDQIFYWRASRAGNAHLGHSPARPEIRPAADASERMHRRCEQFFVFIPLLMQYFPILLIKIEEYTFFEWTAYENKKEVAKPCSLWNTLKCMPSTPVFVLHTS